MHAEEALVVGEGDADGGLTLGLGVEQHADASLSSHCCHQGVVADVKADHAHRNWSGNRRFDIRLVGVSRDGVRIWVGRSDASEGMGPCTLGRAGVGHCLHRSVFLFSLLPHESEHRHCGAQRALWGTKEQLG
jgi:hypothetical protein